MAQWFESQCGGRDECRKLPGWEFCPQSTGLAYDFCIIVIGIVLCSVLKYYYYFPTLRQLIALPVDASTSHPASEVLATKRASPGERFRGPCR